MLPLVDVPKEVRRVENFIGAKWVTPETGKYIDVTSPWTGSTIGQVAVSGTADVKKVVDAAAAAFPVWRQMPIKERCGVLFRLRDLILQNLEDLANTAASECGKTRDEARAGIMKGVEVLEFATSLQNSCSGGAMEVSRGVTCEMTRAPLGVVVGIVPFNFPAMVPMWMYPIALALGNVFVMKPSEKVPLTSAKIADLTVKAGFPPGVFSLVNGKREAVEALIDHPAVQAVAFVGSTPVAKSVYTRTTALGKRALCLGGAKNLLLVVPDADAQMTARGVVDSFTGCAGQRCMAASLMLAVGDVDHLINKIVATAKGIALGAGMGAIIDKDAHARIIKAIGQAERDGAKIILDGRQAPPPPGYEGGNWIGPTIIDHARVEMGCSCDEIFGPVLTIVRVKNITEATAIENQSPFGNACSVFTSSGAVARQVAGLATNGMIGINIGVPVPREPFSFGGTKESKFGACDITGESAVEFWTSLKKITTKWAPQADNNWMS
jgi:malonate-semialdehyde dehydrogenase (acetylating)/methylmalonate-semialdehyde dehydrogenase